MSAEAAANSGPVLQSDGLVMRFGGLTAVGGVSFAIERGQIFSIIGPNGAGKTTVFNAVTGIYEPTEGRITIDGHDPRKAFTGGTALGIALIGAFVAFLAVVSLNLEPLWEATVTKNFIYQKPFPYLQAWSDLFKFLGALPLRQGIAPALVGAFLGCAGAAAVWMRSRRTPNVIAGAGIARTFQNIRLFQEMTVLENVLVAMDPQLKSGILDVVFRLPRYRREHRESHAAGMELLRFMELEDDAGDVARNLPYGHQRRLEIARALATKPKLILLDEPAAGMNPSETAELMSLIRKIRERGTTVLLIEHDMRVVMGISDRIVVLDYGNKIAEGTPEAIKCDPRVIEAYLGKEEVG